MGKCMYFLRRGMVEVCSGDGSKVYKTLTDGSYFGEISLLVSGRRTASIRAVMHCDLLTLEQASPEYRVYRSRPTTPPNLITLEQANLE